MKPIGYIVVLSLLSATVAGCAGEPPTQTLAPVKVSITGHDFCQIMRRIAGPSGKLTWGTADTPQTINGIRRLAEAYDKRCVPRNSNRPTS